MGWATRTCTELVGSALKSGQRVIHICEQWPACNMDNCIVWQSPLADVEIIPFFPHFPARVWHRKAAPDCHKAGSYISRREDVNCREQVWFFWALTGGKILHKAWVMLLTYTASFWYQKLERNNYHSLKYIYFNSHDQDMNWCSLHM